MIKVSELKRLGVAVVAGDMMRLPSMPDYKVIQDQIEAINNTTSYDGYSITEFAWRENTGEKPDFDGLILLEMARGGSGYATSPGDLRWSLEADSSDIDYWKPCMKSLLAQIKSGDPEQVVAQQAKTATDYLNDCIEVQKQRGEQYDQNGTGERSFAAAAKAFTALTGKELSGSDVCLILTCVKAVRQYSNPERLHEDSLLDGVSYLSLWAEELNKELKPMEKE